MKELNSLIEQCLGSNYLEELSLNLKNNSDKSTQTKPRLTAKLLGAVCLLGGIVIIAVFLKTQNNTSDINANAAETSDLETDANAPTQFQETNDGISQTGGASNSDKATANRPPVVVSQAPFAASLKAQIQRFQGLQQKSVMTEAEQQDLQAMLKNADLLKAAGEVLRSRKAMQDSQFESMQSAAIDLIVQALKQGGDEEAASEAAWDLIRDTQVEDSSIPVSERKILGGIKGEMLYHATAVRPDIFQEVEMDLPGPVSQKIWQNVQGQHQDNLKESQDEVVEYEKEQQEPQSD